MKYYLPNSFTTTRKKIITAKIKIDFFFQKSVLFKIINIRDRLCENKYEALLMDGNSPTGEESYLIKDIYSKRNMI